MKFSPWSVKKYIPSILSSKNFGIISFSGLMGIFEKRRFRKLMIYIMEFNLEDTKTWQGIDPKQNTAEDLYNKFGVDKNTIDVTGHALALHLNDE